MDKIGLRWLKVRLLSDLLLCGRHLRICGRWLRRCGLLLNTWRGRHRGTAVYTKFGRGYGLAVAVGTDRKFLLSRHQ